MVMYAEESEAKDPIMENAWAYTARLTGHDLQGLSCRACFSLSSLNAQV